MARYGACHTINFEQFLYINHSVRKRSSVAKNLAWAPEEEQLRTRRTTCPPCLLLFWTTACLNLALSLTKVLYFLQQLISLLQLKRLKLKLLRGATIVSFRRSALVRPAASCAASPHRDFPCHRDLLQSRDSDGIPPHSPPQTARYISPTPSPFPPAAPGLDPSHLPLPLRSSHPRRRPRCRKLAGAPICTAARHQHCRESCPFRCAAPPPQGHHLDLHCRLTHARSTPYHSLPLYGTLGRRWHHLMQRCLGLHRALRR